MIGTRRTNNNTLVIVSIFQLTGSNIGFILTCRIRSAINKPPKGMRISFSTDSDLDKNRFKPFLFGLSMYLFNMIGNGSKISIIKSEASIISFTLLNESLAGKEIKNVVIMVIKTIPNKI